MTNFIITTLNLGLFLSLLVQGLVFFCLPSLTENEEVILEEQQTVYSRVAVTQNENNRFLKFSRLHSVQSIMDLNDPNRLAADYIQKIADLISDSSQKDNLLFVGLGAGSLPRWLYQNHPKSNATVVEIDPLVGHFANKYFDYDLLRFPIFYEDPKVFLGKSTQNYDIVILDAYDDFHVPFHLTTQEFFHLIRNRLKQKGQLIINVAKPSIKFKEALNNTLESVYDSVNWTALVNQSNEVVSATGHSTIEASSKFILTNQLAPVETLMLQK